MLQSYRGATRAGGVGRGSVSRKATRSLLRHPIPCMTPSLTRHRISVRVVLLPPPRLSFSTTKTSPLYVRCSPLDDDGTDGCGCGCFYFSGPLLPGSGEEVSGPIHSPILPVILPLSLPPSLPPSCLGFDLDVKLSPKSCR